MTTVKKYVKALFLIISLSMSSCEEVITVDLDNTGKVLVAEGYLTLNESATLQLSYTRDYFGQKKSEKVTNAIVTLMDDSGNQETLVHTQDGHYGGSFMIGEVGVSYTLAIELDGTIYVATSQLYEPTTIKEVGIERTEPGFRGGNEGFELVTTIEDNSASENYYLFDYFRDGSKINRRYFTAESRLFSINNEVTFDGGRSGTVNFRKGDEACVRVYRIDEQVHDYFVGLNDAIFSEGIASTTPYNPESNFTPNILGFFAARSFVEQCVIVD